MGADGTGRWHEQGMAFALRSGQVRCHFRESKVRRAMLVCFLLVVGLAAGCSAPQAVLSPTVAISSTPTHSVTAVPSASESATSSLTPTLAGTPTGTPAPPTPLPPTQTPSATWPVPQPTSTYAATWPVPQPTSTYAATWPVPQPTPTDTVASRASRTHTAPATLPPDTSTPTPTIGTPTVDATPADIIVDNRDSRFSTTGWWFIGDGGVSYDGDCAWAPRGIQNIAYVDPELAVAGAYEIYAWWCGDPNHDQSQQARIQIYPARGMVATYPVHVNLQENAGQWNSLGTYYLERGAFLSVDGNIDGNVIADAFRFVYRSPERIIITPTPLPEPFPWTGHPPSPIEQLTSGDLHARLGLVGRFYPYTPIVSTIEDTFDDCQAFPRDGCGGSRDGWRVVVQYQDLVATYRVSKDYQHAVMEPVESLAGRQLLYLHVAQGNRFFRVDRYIDDTWHLSGAQSDLQAGSHLQLESDSVERLRRLVQSYGTVGLATADGMRAILYGLGQRVALSDEDRAALEALVSEWGEIAWMRDAIPQ